MDTGFSFVFIVFYDQIDFIQLDFFVIRCKINRQFKLVRLNLAKKYSKLGKLYKFCIQDLSTVYCSTVYEKSDLNKKKRPTAVHCSVWISYTKIAFHLHYRYLPELDLSKFLYFWHTIFKFKIISRPVKKLISSQKFRFISRNTK
jgi:hypothetical protein